MEKITTIGLDIAQACISGHGINGAGATVSRRKLRREMSLDFSRHCRHA